MQKNFVLIYSLSTPAGPVEVYRELQGSPTDEDGLREALLNGTAEPVRRGSFSVQHAGSGQYFDNPGDCLRYLIERWGKEVFEQMRSQP